MTAPQQHHWALLLEVDENGKGLDRDEIKFVADLIDEDRQGMLTATEMASIRSLHRARVINDSGEDEDDE